MAGSLREYRGKRRFDSTPEPSGAGEVESREGGRFVVQEHHARRLHWDFRLERNGVLVSWALPRGIPPDPKENRLAVHTEDHPLSYLDFEGEIPEGEYGAGSVSIWDRGTYECHKFEPKKVVITLHGERVEGKYALFATRGKDWMIHRMDPPADPEREPMPERLRPMLAEKGRLPRNADRYGYEIDWAGTRAISYWRTGGVRIDAGNGREITGRYPELRRLSRELGATEMILDGEVVLFGEDGRPDPKTLASRERLRSESAIRRRSNDSPVTYVIFDLLYLNGRTKLDLPYEKRREQLDELGLDGDHWQTPDYHRGEGKAVLEAARAQGLDGIMAKRLDSAYEPGKRTGAWVAVAA